MTSHRLPARADHGSQVDGSGRAAQERHPTAGFSTSFGTGATEMGAPNTATERNPMSQATQQAVPTGTWSADRIHSTVGFAVPYMAGTFQGTFSYFDANLSDGALRGSAEVASVQVKDPNLETHLQSPEFFDAERFPQLSFEAREIGRSGDDLTIAGELTLKGHTEAVEIKGHVNDP